MREHEEWYKRAQADLALAQIAYHNQFYAHACFLCQQATEKICKAFLLWKSGSYPRTHGLVDLLRLCAGYESSVLALNTDCQILDQYYTATRYPGSGAPDPSDIDAQDAFNRASTIMHQIANLLP